MKKVSLTSRTFGLTRRRFLAASGLAGAVLSPAVRAIAAALDRTRLAEDAVIWGLPLVLTGRYLQLAAKDGVEFNRFYLNRDLATPDLNVVGPNVNVLYGLGWIDVTAEPQILTVPDTHDRYYSLQLMDAFDATFGYVSRRTTGTAAGAFAITGPRWSGSLPANIKQIKSPSNLVVCITRTLVMGESQAELEVARASQADFVLGPLSKYPADRRKPVIQAAALRLPNIDLSGAGAGFFDELGVMLKTYPPAPADAASLAHFASLGIGPGRTPSRESGVAPLLAAAVPAGVDQIMKTNTFFKKRSDNWFWSPGMTSTEHEDTLMRASVNILGPGWHLVQEAMYFMCTVGADGKPLNGERNYRLTFPRGQLPPVDAFWSVTMYSGLFTLVPNPINRYAVYTHTPGLKSNPDGSLDIFLQHGAPASGTSNWLPAPTGPFTAFIRTYQPRASLIDGSYQLPPIQPV